MLRQLRQRLSRKMRADRVILERGAEFIPDLFIDRIDNLLTRKHNEDSSPDYPPSSSDYGAAGMDANGSILGSARRGRVEFGRWPNAFPLKF